MKTIYVIQNGDEEPVMAFLDEGTAQYVAHNNEGTRGIYYKATLFENECATPDQVLGVDNG